MQGKRRKRIEEDRIEKRKQETHDIVRTVRREKRQRCTRRNSVRETDREKKIVTKRLINVTMKLDSATQKMK